MSDAADVPTEAPESIRSDVFVEVRPDASIPNNVDLESDRQLQRALEDWHPRDLEWWRAMGPDGFQDAPVYLRTATCAPRWASLRAAGPGSAS